MNNGNDEDPTNRNYLDALHQEAQDNLGTHRERTLPGSQNTLEELRQDVLDDLAFSLGPVLLITRALSLENIKGAAEGFQKGTLSHDGEVVSFTTEDVHETIELIYNSLKGENPKRVFKNLASVIAYAGNILDWGLGEGYTAPGYNP